MTIALVTGGTDGIGKAVALQLAKSGTQVVIVGRNSQKGEHALEDIRAQVTHADVTYRQADLSLMHEVNRLADWIKNSYPSVDLLVHSAGVMLPKKTMTSEGLETVFAVQYFARYLLNTALLGHFATNARVINISAGGTMPIKLHVDNINSQKMYHGVYTLMHESVANDVMTLRLIREYPHIQFYGYGPFYVKTNLFSNMPFFFRLYSTIFGSLMAGTPQRSANDVIALATGNHEAGLYARNCKQIHPNKHRADAKLQDELYHATENLIQEALGHG